MRKALKINCNKLFWGKSRNYILCTTKVSFREAGMTSWIKIFFYFCNVTLEDNPSVWRAEANHTLLRSSIGAVGGGRLCVPQIALDFSQKWWGVLNYYMSLTLTYFLFSSLLKLLASVNSGFKCFCSLAVR